MYNKFGKKIKKDEGAMLKQNRTKSLKESMQNAKNVIEHLFNDHKNCDKLGAMKNVQKKKRKNMFQIKKSKNYLINQKRSLTK